MSQSNIKRPTIIAWHVNAYEDECVVCRSSTQPIRIKSRISSKHLGKKWGNSAHMFLLEGRNLEFGQYWETFYAKHAKVRYQRTFLVLTFTVSAFAIGMSSTSQNPNNFSLTHLSSFSFILIFCFSCKDSKSIKKLEKTSKVLFGYHMSPIQTRWSIIISKWNANKIKVQNKRGRNIMQKALESPRWIFYLIFSRHKARKPVNIAFDLRCLQKVIK